MRRRPTAPLLVLALLPAAVAVGAAWSAAPPVAGRPRLPAPADRRVDFVKDVQPILATRCVACHGPKVRKGGLRLDVKASALSGGHVVPGDSANSPLIRRVAGLGAEARMPPKGPGLTPRQVAVLRAWIDQGASWPALADGPAKGAEHWAFRPLERPAVPALKRPGWARNPIDAFVLARLEAAGLAPAPPADWRTLLRRVTFDLTGLPPTPEEVDAFLADDRPGAYERVVERLLASPAHGERWARHWLDVVHFAETHGHDQDVPRENAWPYRDYLIGALNADKPYAHFVEEQIAGDVLYPDDPQAVAALGLLAAGPWDESSQQSIREDTVDKKVAQYLDRDDMVTTVMSAFAGATVHCARCHDHKFDPISQEEHYALQAVFAGVDRANRAYDPDPATHRRHRALLARRAELRAAAAPALLSAAAQAEVAAWEKARAAERDAWVVLRPAAVTTEKGSVAVKLADGSVRFGGPRPAVDTYRVVAHTGLRGITAVRLEVLTDDSLPHRGPGRQDNGNLHLNEFRIHAAARGEPGAGAALPVRRARADFDQEGWTAAMAVDGNPRTAWGIYPAVGRPHQAVFELREPAGFAGGTTLTFTLEQTHGGGHLIGRLRLSVTTAAPPPQVRPLPAAAAAALAVPAARRSVAQKAELARHVLLQRVESDLAALPPQQRAYAGASDFKPEGSFKPARGCRPVFVLRRGDIHSPGARAVPGALACVPGLPAKFALANPEDEGARRAALARWLSDRRNVLTWRTAANRAWHHHFGRGIVATPSDLGRMGARPTHPELLDWLAVELRDGGGSLKRLHRLIVTSATYRQSSLHHPGHAKVDGDNLLLWRMNMTRLDAECVRDAVLRASGKLDRTMGGPSVKHFLQSPGIHVTPKVDYAGFDVDGPGAHRRSVYRFLFRTLPDPFLDALDCPDASQFTPVRSNSVTPLQALALLNDRFMVRQAEHFAGRLRREVPGDVAGQVRRAYELALGRPATAREVAALAGYAGRHGLANACRLLLNCNEFLFVP
jgi:mono/diheme cytochrome c family protein